MRKSFAVIIVLMCIKGAVTGDFMLSFDGYARTGAQLFNLLIINNFDEPVQTVKQADHIVLI